MCSSVAMSTLSILTKLHGTIDCFCNFFLDFFIWWIFAIHNFQQSSTLICYITPLVLGLHVVMARGFLNARAAHNSSHDYSRQGLATAWLISERPGSVIPVSKMFTLVGVHCPLQGYPGSITILVIPLSLLWIMLFKFSDSSLCSRV